MKKIFAFAVALFASVNLMATGWPTNYGGVMLQGFSWDAFSDSQWSILEKQAGDFNGIFDLIWVPQSGKCLESYQTMGYTPFYYFNQNSSFGSEQELRSMISVFKKNNIGTIADVVINHHNTDGWWGFPAETYKGKTYQFATTDIVANDDGGNVATQAKKDGVTLSSHNDDGTDWGGMRDLDHQSANVQNIVKAYENFLLNDLGYAGFRYDMVKGFAGSHIKDYNTAANVTYSVGECWDGNSTIMNWINATDKTSAAFDFQFKYNVRDAQSAGNWNKLYSNNNLIHDANYRQYAVTFVENHDTQVRPDGTSSDPVRKDTLAVNAYLLAMPGTPCVFFPHYKAYKKEIKNMILARKAAGINNQSEYFFTNPGTSAYTKVTTDEKLLAFIGASGDATADASEWQLVLSGYKYKYFLSKSLNTVWADQPNGIYKEAINVKLNTVSTDANAKIVYTLDGSEPTAASKQLANGASLKIGESATLKAGLLIGSKVTNVITRKYVIDTTVFEPYTIKVYVNIDKAGWGNLESINFWTWGGDGSHAPANSSWPGDAVSKKETVNGKTWFVKEFTINSETDFVDFVFSKASGSPQTVDISNINQTKFYEVSSTQAGGKNELVDVTAATGIEKIASNASKSAKSAVVYNLAGQRVGNDYKGIVVKNGKKYIAK